ncbi:DoxX family protein [Porticoccaceae bacterium]|nr:DoxX family protein [Porticoccaceae bacterium]
MHKPILDYDRRGVDMVFLDNLLEGREEQSYALLRIVSGFLFIWHGTQKLFNFPADFPYPLNPLMYSAGAIELVGGVLVMIGLLTRPAAFICSGTMAVAYWMAHGMNSLFPLINRGELAALFCFVFLFIAVRGAGIWSLDKRQA